MNHEAHEEHEAGTDVNGLDMLSRTTSLLPPDVERTGCLVIGAAISVHRDLGPGYLERIYADALCLEFAARGIHFERERPLVVMYRGTPISGQRVDLVVENQVIVELKAVTRIERIHEATVLSYPKTAGLRLGLLINFHERLLKNGIQRLVL